MARFPVSSELKSILGQLIKVKSISSFQISAQQSKTYSASLTAFDLTFIGLGSIVGTGLFVLSGTAAALYTGPAVTISFLFAGITAAVSALCYSEMASMLPYSGSAYSYTYATMGELAAWIIGWDLILEYILGSATIAVGWSGYMAAFIGSLGVNIDSRWTRSPIEYDPVSAEFTVSGNIMNVPALIAVLLVTALLLFGVKKTIRLNFVAVCVKLMVIFMFLLVAFPRVDPQNWKPFIPDSKGENGKFGISGIFQACNFIFFSFVGFDSVTAMSRHCQNPQRDIPRGILFSLVISIFLYIIVTLFMTGLVPYTQLDVSSPISVAIEAAGTSFMSVLIDIGAIFSLGSVLLISLQVQPLIFAAMVSDGLLPRMFGSVHSRYGTPWMTIISSGLFCSLAAALLPIDILGEMTSVGSLFSLLLVSIGVIIMRRRRPDLPRKFRIPGGTYFIPCLSALLILIIMCFSSYLTILRLFVWMAVGLIFYGFFGFGRSHMKTELKESKSQETMIKPLKYLQMEEV